MAQGLSLTPAKQAPSTPESERFSLAERTGINIPRGESWLSLLGGGGLLAFALWRRGKWGALAVLPGCELLRRGISRHSFLYRLLNIDRMKAATSETSPWLSTERAVTINRPPQELYITWRDFEQLPALLSTLKEVQVQNFMHSRWIAQLKGERSLAWEAEIVSEEPGEHITWRTLPGSSIAHQGTIRFTPAPGNRGTEVKVMLEYMPPGGRLADLFARALGMAPTQRLRESLRQFKAVMEAGEVPRT